MTSYSSTDDDNSSSSNNTNNTNHNNTNSPSFFEVENWYELLPPSQPTKSTPWRVEPAVPIVDHEDEITAIVGSSSHSSIPGSQTATEFFSFVKGVVTEPLVVASKLARVNLKHGLRVEKKKARIRVKLRLEVNTLSDVLSHTWLPPVPPVPTEIFEPKVTLSLSKKLHKLVDPYIDQIVAFANAVKWSKGVEFNRANVKRYSKWVAVWVLHVFLGLKTTLVCMHLYAIFYLLTVMRALKKQGVVHAINNGSVDSQSNTPLLQRHSSFAGDDAGDEAASMNVMINWIGKKIGNAGLNNLQTTLRNVIELVEEVQSITSDLALTKGCLGGALVSGIFVTICSLRVVTLVYSLSLLFVLSPSFLRMVRISVGCMRGFNCYLQRKKLFLIYLEDSSRSGGVGSGSKDEAISWPSKQD
jgi:hypothetical protein